MIEARSDPGAPADRLTLVLGGARSGKSRHAEALVRRHPPPWTYVATAQAFDEEMRARIALHRGRRDERWVTIEVGADLVGELAALPANATVLVDCLTLWLTTVLLAERDVEAEIDGLVSACREARGPLVLVSNEVGLGIVPNNALVRRFRDHAGLLHQKLAEAADRVEFMVAGLPLSVKEGGDVRR